MLFRELDEIDNVIINLLRKDARMSYSDIADEVGLSRVAVKNRVVNLEANGYITGYHAEINPIKKSGTMPFYAYIETEPAKYESIVEKLKAEPAVSCLFKTSGNSAIYMICATESKKERAEFADRVRKYDGLTCFSTKDIWEVVKGNILPD